LLEDAAASSASTALLECYNEFIGRKKLYHFAVGLNFLDLEKF